MPYGTTSNHSLTLYVKHLPLAKISDISFTSFGFSQLFL
jgi:hypothetical protein